MHAMRHEAAKKKQAIFSNCSASPTDSLSKIPIQLGKKAGYISIKQKLPSSGIKQVCNGNNPCDNIPLRK